MSERTSLERLSQLVSAEAFGHAPGHDLDEALALFASARLTPDEGRAIDMLLAAHASRRLPDALAVAVAAALVDRGDDTTASRTLEQATSPAALTLRADLLAKSGRAAEAADVIEQVILGDIDWPGARERHARWRKAAARAPDRSVEASSAALVDPSGGANRPLAAPERDLAGPSLLVIHEIARGGAGTVYEARDRDLGRRVALKVYHRPERDRALLLHEVKVAVKLAGAGVVPLFDVNPAMGWIAMGWAELGALGLRLHTDAAGVGRHLDAWAGSLARALARVHEAGWVHHDVKPANVLLASADEAWLSDFATARRLGEPPPPGSLGYVSPERLAGRASHPKDDIFGFGRVVADALEAAKGHGGSASVAARWRAVAERCSGPDGDRPVDGRALCALCGVAAP